MAKKEPAPQKATATSPWEWVTAAIGGVLITAAISYMVWYGITAPGGVPELKVQAVDTVTAGTAYIVEVSVRNQGNSTAANVEIEGELMGPDGQTEISEVTVDFIPQKSETVVYLQFSKDPADFQLRLRVKGMTKP